MKKDSLQKLITLVQELDKNCHEMQVPVLVAFKDAEDSYKATPMGYATDDRKLHLAEKFLTSSLDEFLTEVINLAQKEGHSSVMLKAMGIPEKPL